MAFWSRKKNALFMKPKKAGLHWTILPGSVFDEKKNRVGYGGGFYDRYFEKRKDICRIAAAYEMQIVEEIETEEFDLPADYVTTEERCW